MKAILYTLVKGFEFELAVPLSEFDNSVAYVALHSTSNVFSIMT